MSNDVLYSWVEEHKKSSLLEWVITVLTSQLLKEDHDGWAELREKSANFTKISLTMQMNGVEVDVNHFITRLEESYKSRVEIRSYELVEDFFEELFEPLAEARDNYREEVNRILHSVDMQSLDNERIRTKKALGG